MSVVLTTSRGGAWTRADLEQTPDDGRRYELLDGVLLVSAAPSTRHQDMVLGLAVLLRAHLPSGHKVLIAPFDVVLSEDTLLQPDVMVARRSDVTSKELPGPPLLAVEVLSPSTRRIDLLLKRDRLQEAGVPSYWLVDPEEPSVTVLELHGGVYVERARSVGAQGVTVDQPFPVTVVAQDLLDD